MALGRLNDSDNCLCCQQPLIMDNAWHMCSTCLKETKEKLEQRIKDRKDGKRRQMKAELPEEWKAGIHKRFKKGGGKK